jgi:hypothetical protein
MQLVLMVAVGLASGELSHREMIAMCRIVVSMTRADLRAAQRSPNPPRTGG